MNRIDLSFIALLRTTAGLVGTKENRQALLSSMISPFYFIPVPVGLQVFP